MLVADTLDLYTFKTYSNVVSSQQQYYIYTYIGKILVFHADAQSVFSGVHFVLSFFFFHLKNIFHYLFYCFAF